MAEVSAPALQRSDEPSAAQRWATPLVLLAAAACWPQLSVAGPHLYDAGELVAASWTLGGSHPPGQPLHALLAHVFALIPLGPIPARVALFSVACALCAAALASRLSRELAAEIGASDGHAQLGGAAAALGVLLTPPVLRQALRPEVYTLALALTLFSVLQLLHWARGRGASHLWLAAFVAGIAGAVHPPHALAAALAALGFAIAQPSLLQERPIANVLGSIGFGSLGLCSYAYLPARAAAGATMWGDPLTIAGFLGYVSAKAYAGKNLVGEQGSVFDQMYDYGRYLVAQGGAVSVAAVLALVLIRARSRKPVLIGATLGAWLAVLAACIHPIEPRNPDNIAYLGPAASLVLAVGAAALAALCATRWRWLAVGGLVALALQPTALPRAAETLRADLPVLETLGGALLEAPAPRSLVIATTDFTAATWMMAQTVDAARPDAALFVAGLSTSSWQWKQLARHPPLGGRPFRARGTDPHEQYLRGAILSASPHIPVAIERDVAGIDAPHVAGAYAVIERRVGPAPANPLPSSISERLDALLASDASSSPTGDSGAGAAIVREYQQQRTSRLSRLSRAHPP